MTATTPGPARLPEAAAQRAFARACLDPEAPVPPGVRAASPERARRRFAIYRNNVVVSLMEALAANFPATEKVVGEDFFRETARLFVRAHPPRGPLLSCFGDDFPDFLDTFAPVAELPYLPDLARLEVAALSAFHAADAAPLRAERLARLTPDQVMALPVALHPAMRLVRSAHPVATIWRMNREVEPLGEIACWSGQDALVTRPAFAVGVIALPAGAAAFLERLRAGAPLGHGVDAALGVPGANLSSILGAVVSAGALIAIPSSSEQQP